jgi:hypothetical protein
MPATTRFSLDGGYVPLSQEIGGFVAGDRAEAGILITGFDPATDVLDQIIFTAKVNPADADNAPTTVQKVLVPGNPANGTITSYDGGGTILAAFDLLPADTLVLLSLHSYDVRVWVTRSGSTYNRTVQIGRTVAIQGITTQTQFTYPTVEWASIQHTPTTVAGYGITDAYTKTQADARYMALAGGDGSGITNLSATQLSTGIVPAARLVGAYSGITGVGTLASLIVSGSITGGSFVGNLTGNVTGTILTAAQPNITSLGVLTALDVAGTFTTTAIATSSFTASASSLGSASATSLSVSGAASVGTLSVAGPFAVGEGMTVTEQAQDSWALVLEAFSASIAGSVSIQFHSQAGRSLGSSIVGDKTATGGLIFNVNNGATQALALAASGVASFAVGAIFGGALSGISTISTSGAINSQTISATANFTGSLTIQNGFTVVLGGASITGNSTITGTLGGITTLTATSFVGALTGDVLGNVTGNVSGSSGSTTGNAATATALQTARAINGVSFDGTAPITVTAAAGTLSGTTLNATVVTSSLTAVGIIATGTWHGDSIATTYTDAKLKTLTGTLNRIVIGGTATDPTVDLSTSYAGQNTIATVGTVTAGVWNGTAIGNSYLASGIDVAKLTTGTTLPANVVSSSLTSVGTLATLTVTAAIVGSITGSSSSTTGNAATATALQTGRAINGVTFDGTAPITIAAAAGTLTGTTLAATVVTTSITSTGTITSGTWQGGAIAPAYGGTGINNGASTITIGGALSFVGAFTAAITLTAATAITLPTSGTLVNTAVTTLSSLASIGTVTTGVWNGSSIATTYTDAKVVSISGTTDKITIGGTATVPTITIASTYGGQSSIITVGTITTGTWTGTAIANAYIATGLDATKLTVGATLPSNVLASSLTSVGTLAALTVTATITGSISGNAATATNVAVSGITGTTLPAGIVTSSLTTVGALNAGSITSGFGAIDVGGDSITGGAASFSTGVFTSNVTLGNAGSYVDLSATTGKNVIILGSTGTNFGFISQINSTTWGFTWGTLRGTLGTSALTWNDSGAVAVTGSLTAGAISGTTGTYSSTVRINKASDHTLELNATTAGTGLALLDFMCNGASVIQLYTDPATNLFHIGGGLSLNVSTGALSNGAFALTAGAISGTTIGASSTVTITGGDLLALSLRSGNAAKYTYLSLGNTAETFNLSCVGAANQFVAGSAAGDTVLNAVTGTFWISSGGVSSLKILYGGAATFASTVKNLTATGIDGTLADMQYFARSDYPTQYMHKIQTSHSGTANLNKWVLSLSDGTTSGYVTALSFVGAVATFASTVAVTGILSLNGAVTTSAAAGDLVLKYGGYVRSSNNAASNTRPLIGLGTNGLVDMLFLSPGSTSISMFGMDMTNAQASNNIGILSGSAPTGNPTGGGFLWVEAGALKYRGTGGTVTTIGPA